MSVVAHQRTLLVSTLRTLKPYQWDLPSLCEGWTVTDVVAHLIVRERQPWTGIGLVVPKYAHWHTKAMATMATKSHKRLLTVLDSGPSLAMRAMGGIQVCEDWIHWQDIVRGISVHDPNAHSLDRDTGTSHDDIRRVLEAKLPMYSKGLLSRVQGEVRVHITDGEELGWTCMTGTPSLTGGTARPSLLAGRVGTPDVTLTGEVGELLLWMTGRQDQASVALTGAPEAMALLRGASGAI